MDLSYVVNYVEINFSTESLTNSIDSIRFHAFPAPINFGNTYKSKWYAFDLKDDKVYSTIDLCNAIVDSIINAKVLFKEK